MKYQRRLHEAFGEKVVPVKARRAAFDVASEADEAIERLQANVKSLAAALESVMCASDGDGCGRTIGGMLQVSDQKLHQRVVEALQAADPWR